MNVDKEKITRSLRGTLLISATIFIVAMFISQILFPVTSLDPVVENGASLSPFNYIATILLVGFILVASSTPLTVLFTGLLLGGASANYIEHLVFGPVDDYIYVPFSGDLYCNIADVAILSGIIVCALTMIFNQIKHKALFRVTVF